MTGTNPLKILGAIGAMYTLVENFPMSILDSTQGATPTSVFIFLLDVLEQCNVPIQDIVNRLINKVYGIEVKIQGGINTIYDSINNLEIDEQSQFFKTLEDGVKTILMALFTGIFSCSAVPILPTRNMDLSKAGMRQKYVDHILDFGETIIIPREMMDIFGCLDVSPFSNEGRLYYSVQGGDKYYKKQKRTEIITYEGEYKEVPVCDQFSEVYLQFGEGHADYMSGQNLYMEDEVLFRIAAPVEKDIIITVNYTNSDGFLDERDLTILAGQRTSEIFFITPNSPIKQKEEINSIKIKLGEDDAGDSGQIITSNNGKTTFVYLSEVDSREVINFWKSQDNDSLENIQWGKREDCGTRTLTLREAESENVDIYEYVETGMISDAVRMNYVPVAPDEDSPEYIVSYQGVTPETLYKSDDMNAFLWYVLNMSENSPQAEVNKCMWDSRKQAKGEGVSRKSNEQWNDWYNSKGSEHDEFYFGENSENFPELYPIVQISREGGDVGIVFPAQRYFKPSALESDTEFTYDSLRVNGSLYRFNYEYLKSITIFNPKQILFGMFDALLNGALTALLSIRLNPTRKETETLLSTAIKNYIEAEDTEVEDCYFKFSNEDFDNMLQEMLLARYNAVSFGGEVVKAKQLNVEEIIGSIDEASPSATQAGDTTKIMKTITEVSTIPGEEGEVSFGFNPTMDDNWWKRIIWAMALPIIRCIFTPQLMLLILINFRMMGIVTLEDLFNTNQSAIIKLLTNKIFSMVRSIMSYIKDQLANILLEFFAEVILPTIGEYQLLKLKESLDSWISLLLEAIFCVRLFKFRRSMPVGSIDAVDYADIINEQKTPETEGGC